MERNKNLRDIDLTHEEAVDYGRRGGVASGEARRKKRLYRDIIAKLGEEEFVKVAMPDASERRMSFTEAECLALHRRAIKGDVKAIRLLMEISGELKQTVELEGAQVILLPEGELKTFEKLKK